MPRLTVEQRFFAKVRNTDPLDCWEWTSAPTTCPFPLLLPDRPNRDWPNMQYTPRHDPTTLGVVTSPEPPYQPFTTTTPPPRRGLPTGAIVGIILGALGLLVCGGIAAIGVFAADPKPRAVTPGVTTPTTTSVPEPVKTTPKTVVVQLGETLVYTTSGIGSGDEVHYTVAAGKPLTRTNYGSKPEKGVFFSVTATIVAVKGSAYACSCDFALIATDGTAYEPNATYGFDGALEAAQINAGQKAAGLVVWDLPPTAVQGAKIELRADLFADGNQGFWQLP